MAKAPGETTMEFLERGFRHFVPSGMSTGEALVTLSLAAPATLFGSKVGEVITALYQSGEVTPRGLAVSAAVGVLAMPAYLGGVALKRALSGNSPQAAAEETAPRPVASLRDVMEQARQGLAEPDQDGPAPRM